MNLYATIKHVCLLDRSRTWHLQVRPILWPLLTGKPAQWGGRRRWWEGDGLKGQGDLGGILGVALPMTLGRLVNLNSTLLT